MKRHMSVRLHKRASDHDLHNCVCWVRMSEDPAHLCFGSWRWGVGQLGLLMSSGV